MYDDRFGPHRLVRQIAKQTHALLPVREITKRTQQPQLGTMRGAI
jgi:hypothetical protein